MFSRISLEKVDAGNGIIDIDTCIDDEFIKKLLSDLADENVNSLELGYLYNGVVKDSDIILMVVPSKFYRENIKNIKPYIKDDATIIIKPRILIIINYLLYCTYAVFIAK